MAKVSKVQTECYLLLDALWQRLDKWFARPTQANPALLREVFNPDILPEKRKIHHKKWLKAHEEGTVYWYRYIVRVRQDGLDLPVVRGTRSYGPVLLESVSDTRVKFRPLQRGGKTIELIFNEGKTLASDEERLLFVNYEKASVRSEVKEGTVDLVQLSKPLLG